MSISLTAFLAINLYLYVSHKINSIKPQAFKRLRRMLQLFDEQTCFALSLMNHEAEGESLVEKYHTSFCHKNGIVDALLV